MNLRDRTAVKVKSGLKTSPEWIPQSLRKIIRLLSGGDSSAGQLVRGLFWKYRYFLFLSLVASIFAAIFEGVTFAILTVALETASNGGNPNLESLGIWGTWLQARQDTSNSAQFFFILLFLAVFSQIMRSGLQFLGQVATAYITAWAEGDLRRRLIRQYVTMSYAETSSYKIGDLVSYTEQVIQVGVLLMTLNQLISLILIMMAYITVLLWLSWSITLLALLALFISSLLMKRIIRRIRQLSQQFVEATIAVNAYVVEYLNGLRVIHVFSREQYAIDRTSQIINKSILTRRQSLIWKSSVKPLIESVAIIGLVIVLVIGLEMQDADNSSIARLGIFMLIIYRLLPRITTLNGYIAGINNWIPFTERIAKMLQSGDKEYMVSGLKSFPAFRGKVVFENVFLKYSGKEDKFAVKDISFTIECGKTIAFVGASGAGKSTIINLILRLYDPSQGRIIVDNHNLKDLDLRDWRNCIGVVDQDTFVFNDTVIENIRIGQLNAKAEDVQMAAQTANAHDFIEDLPSGYATEIGNRGLRLSGGQRQRLAIARAIIRNPDILIFDEATSSLDSQSERLIRESLENLRRKHAIIIIAHRLSTVMSADKIIVLDGGKIVEQGVHEELLKMDGNYANLWHMQTSVTNSL